MGEKTIKVRIRLKLGDGRVSETKLELPVRTGDEGFDFLVAFQKKSGGPLQADPARERRWLEMMARRKKDGLK